MQKLGMENIISHWLYFNVIQGKGSDIPNLPQ